MILWAFSAASSIPVPPPTSTPCSSGYITWYSSCYKLVSEPKTWEEAQQACVKEGGNLASVDMSYDQAFISAAVQQGKTDAWIGLRRLVLPHSLMSITNVKQNSSCCSSPAGWQRFVQMVRRLAEKPPSTPAPGDGKCSLGWWSYGRYCYYAYNGKVGYSWPEARHICQEVNGGELASIHSRAEVEFIRNINYTKYHNVWIGLTRDHGWGWTDLTSLGFTNWAPGEPNEAFHDGDVGKENCVEMYHDGTWNDNNCVQKRDIY
uniref:C-type lectin domain-containing protein n=1 Tax=Cyprinus carpio TaxID=7962 RepID=A0A8C2GRF6_CYPCA